MTMTRNWNDTGLLLLRLGLGVVFVAHGAQKAFVFGLAGVAGMFGGLGIPFPELSALVVTGLEIVGGLALLAGAFTRYVAPLLAFTMLVAIATVHLANGFFMATNGYEFAFTLLVASLALTATGSGAYSVDALWRRRAAESTERMSELSRAA